MLVAAEFDNERDAAIAAGMLENNGIRAIVDGSIMTTIYAAGATWAPVKLYVADGDIEAAKKLLEQHKD